MQVRNERKVRGGNEAVDLEADLEGVGMQGMAGGAAAAVPEEPEEERAEDQVPRHETGGVRKSTG